MSLTDQQQRIIWQQWIDAITTEGRDLTPWEESFVESVADQLTRGRYLSEKQAAILERIYAEKTP